MSLIFPSWGGSRRTIDPRMHGNIAIFGNTRDESASGAWMMQLIPDVSWVGSVVVVGRIAGISTTDETVPFDPIPVRILNRDNVAQDGDLRGDSPWIIISGKALVQIPANQMSVGILISCTDGFATVISRVLDGPTSL